MKRDRIIERSWRQLEIAFPVPIAPPTFASPQAAYNFFTQHEDEFPQVDHSEPDGFDLDSGVSEFGQNSLDAISGVMSDPVLLAPDPAPDPAPEPVPEPTPEPAPEP